MSILTRPRRDILGLCRRVTQRTRAADSLHWSVSVQGGNLGVELQTRDSALAARLRRAVAGTPTGEGSSSAELLISELDVDAAPRAARSGKLVVPLHLDFFVPRDPGPRIRREWRLPRLTREGLELSVSRSHRQVQSFYETLYLPTHARRNPEGNPSPLEDAIDNARRGWLVLIEKDRTPVAGGLFCRSPVHAGESWFSHLGYAEGAPAFIRAAPYVAVFDLSRRFGFAATDLVAALPILSDGLAQHKLLWGSHVRTFPSSRRCLSLRFSSTPSLIRFCEQHPVVALGRERLTLLTRGSYRGRLPTSTQRLDLSEANGSLALEELTHRVYECSECAFSA